MIGTSWPEYLLIRASVIGLRAVTPLSIGYCIIRPFFHSSYPFNILELYPLLESTFYFLFFLPRKWSLQRPAEHPPLLSRAQRRELFKRCQKTTPEPDAYLSKWFKDAPLEDIKRDNVKEFYNWAFLNSGTWNPEDEEELEECIQGFEKTLGKKFEPGRGKAECLRLTLDPVHMIHRPLIWYLAVWFVDNFTHLSLLYHNFRYHRTHVASNTFTIPIRPLTLLASHLSPVPTLSYWHRPHTSKTHLPIIFIHGIGIGLIPYIPFLTALNANSLADSTIGILAIELLPISFRISAPLPKVTELISQISTIIQRHGITSFILVTHSYGSVLNTHMIRSPALGPRIFATILVDPVTLLLHTPPVAYNFTLRKPRLANERQLYYFASKDMMVAHTLHRSFFWSANVVWKEDLLSLEPGMLDTGSKTAEKEGSANPKKRHVTVFLGGRDLIVDTKAVAEYLTADEPPSSFSSSTTTSPDKWKNTEAGWTSQDGNLKVVWCGVCDHAQIFDHYRKWRRVLVDEVLRLSALGAAEKAGVIEVEEDEDEVEGQLEDEYKDEEELDEKLEEYMDADVDVYVDVDVDVDVE